jgi:hypothetical protein
MGVTSRPSREESSAAARALAVARALAGGARLVTVHGLGGMGASTVVAEALASTGLEHSRVALPARGGAGLARRVAARAPRSRVVFLDDAHRSDASARFVRALVELDPRLVLVVAARAPLGLPGEHLVPLAPWTSSEIEGLLAAELTRLGAREIGDLGLLAQRIDGWPSLAIACALRARTIGVAALAEDSSPLLGADRRHAAIVRSAMDARSPLARRVLSALAALRAPIAAADVASCWPRGTSSARVERALAELSDHGLVHVSREHLVRVPSPVRERLRPASDVLLEAQLVHAERAMRRYRRAPSASVEAITRVAPDLVSLARAGGPRRVARAVLALEPCLVGSLDRPQTMELWDRARRAMPRCDRDTRARVAMGLARTWIARGEHESARALLVALEPRALSVAQRATRAIFLGHIALWARDGDAATRWLEEARNVLHRAERSRAGLDERARDALTDAAEDLLTQEIFRAFRSGDLTTLAARAREAAERASTRPSPRALAVARRFVAEAALEEGDPRRAAELFDAARRDLEAMGDHVSALGTTSRYVLALRALGEHARADDEEEAARARAASAREATLELMFLGAAGTSVSRVHELAWRTQIAVMREEATRWVAERPAVAAIAVRLDRAEGAVRVGSRRASFAKRPTLLRLVAALIEAHASDLAVGTEALFTRGWPGTRIAAGSRKQRVQTAIWTLRRELFGDALESTRGGYRLARHVTIEP